MTLSYAPHGAMEMTPTAGLSPSLRRLRKSLTEKIERLCSSPSSQKTRSSSLSSQAFDDDLRFSLDPSTRERAMADIKRLDRIEAVRVEYSIRKHDHRHYVLHVYLKSARTPIYRRDPNYEIDVPYALFFSLRDSVVEASQHHTAHCDRCLNRITIIDDHDENAHDLRRLLRSPQEKEKRLEKFLHCLLGVGMDTKQINQINDDLCEGCTATTHVLTAFLKRTYEPSTGII